MGIIEILRRIWLFSADKIKGSESFSNQPTQLTAKLNLAHDCHDESYPFLTAGIAKCFDK